MTPGFTLNAGVRWTYSSPITELYGRLVNLAIGPDFSSITPVCGTAVAGCTPASQAGYPDSLIKPDKHDFQPRIAFSWRPLPASSMVVRGSYGVYYNTSVYQNIAVQMAQQSPLSYSVQQPNSPTNPFTMANAFLAPATNSTATTFAVDPNFRIGYAQNWQLSVQRDLPGAMVLQVTYLGIKGTRGMQEFLPNTYPSGAVSPHGYTDVTSNGNSTREAGTVQLRRRLHNGFQASVQYTYAKAIDDSAMGGNPGLSGNPGPSSYVIAQNWLDLAAERALSSFDQRHYATAQIQYTTGMGVGGGALVNGWKGALFKEWTVLSQITAGTGLPLTPTLLSPVPGTGVTGILRPEYTGAPVYAAQDGLHLNPEAYTTPPAGEWGNAGRDSITGPAQFSLNASLQRTFRLNDRFNGDLQINATNALNHVTFPSWNTQFGSPLFGLPPSANAMRGVSTTFRVRF
jgi:trimeric autotransporter adhesin